MKDQPATNEKTITRMYFESAVLCVAGDEKDQWLCVIKWQMAWNGKTNSFDITGLSASDSPSATLKEAKKLFGQYYGN